MLQHTRLLNFLGFFLVLSLIALAFILQVVEHLQPCPLCIFQRIAFIWVAWWFFLFALLPQRLSFRRTQGVLQFIFAGAGFGIALRQIYLQYMPGHAPASCGPGLQVLLQQTNLPNALIMVFQGTGDCSLIDWHFLGLSMAVWSALAFLFFVIWALVWIFKK